MLAGGESMIPRIYFVPEISVLLRSSESYVRAKLRDRTFSGIKLAGRWAMTEPQIEAAIKTMTVDARPADPPSPAGLSKHSRLRRRLQAENTAW
jgi:hypothetical protein